MSFGGGGGSSSSTATVPEEFKPFVRKVLGIQETRLSNLFDKSGNLKQGALENVLAGFSPEQVEGQTGQAGLARQAMTGTGIYDDRAAVNRMLQNVRGAQDAQMQGFLGSARADKATQSVLADKAYDFQTARQQKAEGGAQSLQDVGTTRQEQKQRMLDAPYDQLAKSANLLGAAGTETKSTGGGK